MQNLPNHWPLSGAYIHGDRLVAYEPLPQNWLAKVWWHITKRKPRAVEMKIKPAPKQVEQYINGRNLSVGTSEGA